MTRPTPDPTPLTPLARRHPRIWGLAAAVVVRIAAWVARWER